MPKLSPSTVKARRQARRIVRRLARAETTVRTLAAEYGCQPRVITQAALTVVSKRRWRRIVKNLRGSSYELDRDAKKIVERLRNTPTTLALLMTEYGCGYGTLMHHVRRYIKTAEWRQIRRGKCAQGGVKTRFRKGHAPANKGRKGVHYSPETEFKKGMIPLNGLPVGTVTIRTDKAGRYQMIATPGPTPHRHIWIPYARYLWEKANGPVPAGRFVIHKDGDRLNDVLENLILVDRAGHIARMKLNNPLWRKKASVSIKKVNAVKRKVRARQKREQVKRAKVQSQLEDRRLARARELLEKDAREEQLTEQRKAELYGPKVTWYECACCSFESAEKFNRCPKCSSYQIEKITQRRLTKVAR